MPSFSFAYNIGDIVCFAYVPNSAQLRGTVNSIIIGKDEALYMVQSRYACHPVKECDILRPIFSTKSFDVFYPGVEVYIDTPCGEHTSGFIESARITDGRIYYEVTDAGGFNARMVDGSFVRLADTVSNINKFN